MSEIDSAGVLRLRAQVLLSRDKSVMRSAQDDDFVGVLTKNPTAVVPSAALGTGSSDSAHERYITR